MTGYLALVLHAHLPFVRHPEHERFLEENWLFEAITETYLPLLEVFAGWARDQMQVPVAFTLTPTLCSMLDDPLLRARYERHLDRLLELAEKETHRTRWDDNLRPVAEFYFDRFTALRKRFRQHEGNLVQAFRQLQDDGRIEIITSAATHAVLPLLASHPPSVRAQILVARDHYRHCFGRDPQGIWLPECAYLEGLDAILAEAGLRWCIVDTHGILQARPRPRYGVFAPIYTESGLAVFGRDFDSARQVWSKHEGYPGDPRYRDFYRDIGFDLDWDYIAPYLPDTQQRGFTGIKYHAISRDAHHQQPYQRARALEAAAEHAAHFLEARRRQIIELARVMERPPIVVSPFDAELFGHWWYEGPEFLDFLARKAFFDQKEFSLITPWQFLGLAPTHQVARPAASSWGEEGYWRVWLNETNEWIYPHLHIAQQRMTALVHRFPAPNALETRALQQVGRELLLAQSSDWPFILRTGTSPGYARQRVTDHLLQFLRLCENLNSGTVNEQWLAELEARDNIFPEMEVKYWK